MIVKVKSLKECLKNPCISPFSFIENMKKYCGKKIEVIESKEKDFYFQTEGKGCLFWHKSWLMKKADKKHDYKKKWNELKEFIKESRGKIYESYGEHINSIEDKISELEKQGDK